MTGGPAQRHLGRAVSGGPWSVRGAGLRGLFDIALRVGARPGAPDHHRDDLCRGSRAPPLPRHLSPLRPLRAVVGRDVVARSGGLHGSAVLPQERCGSSSTTRCSKRPGAGSKGRGSSETRCARPGQRSSMRWASTWWWPPCGSTRLGGMPDRSARRCACTKRAGRPRSSWPANDATARRMAARADFEICGDGAYATLIGRDCPMPR